MSLLLLMKWQNIYQKVQMIFFRQKQLKNLKKNLKNVLDKASRHPKAEPSFNDEMFEIKRLEDAMLRKSDGKKI